MIRKWGYSEGKYRQGRLTESPTYRLRYSDGFRVSVVQRHHVGDQIVDLRFGEHFAKTMRHGQRPLSTLRMRRSEVLRIDNRIVNVFSSVGDARIGEGAFAHVP